MHALTAAEPADALGSRDQTRSNANMSREEDTREARAARISTPHQPSTHGATIQRRIAGMSEPSQSHDTTDMISATSVALCDTAHDR